MKFHYTLLATAVVSALSMTTAHAALTVSGSLGGKIVAPLSDDVAGSDQDLDILASKARVNFKAIDKTDGGITLIGEIEVDFDDLANGGGSSTTQSVDVRTAKITAVGGFGAAVIGGRTASGHWNDLVGPVDIFQHGGAKFFNQASRTSAFAAYATPKFAGGIKAVFAIVNPTSATFDNNDTDLDVLAFRAAYSTDAFTANIGYVGYPGFTPSEDWNRIAFSATTKVGPASLGFAYESSTDSPSDADVAGVAASFDIGNGLAASVGLNTILDGAGQDSQAYQLLLKKGLSKKTNVWVEFDGYNDEGKAKLNQENELAFGINYSF